MLETKMAFTERSFFYLGGFSYIWFGVFFCFFWASSTIGLHKEAKTFAFAALASMGLGQAVAFAGAYFLSSNMKIWRCFCKARC